MLQSYLYIYKKVGLPKAPNPPLCWLNITQLEVLNNTD